VRLTGVTPTLSKPGTPSGANGTAPGRPGAAADLFFGGRVNCLSANLRLSGPFQVRSADSSKTWFDPIVGVQLRTPNTGKRWHAQIDTEIGGFGVGSDFTWQNFPTLGVMLTERASIEFGYRWLSIDFETGEPTTRYTYDVLTQGPLVGLILRFKKGIPP
jgi:hypothetical protein